ncbi:MAG: NYN domain-containing protein [Candidatus Saccharibacteria bacterium]|nr:NYN domain-containing protein [Candidatus Saccharibacteria bacterium]
MKNYIYIDGENFRHRIIEALKIEKKISHSQEFSDLLFNFRQLFANILGKDSESFIIRYYGTRTKLIKNQGSYLAARTQLIINSNRKLKRLLQRQNIEFVECGNLKIRDGDKCNNCKMTTQKQLQEKGVDVRLAVDMIVNHKKGDYVFLASSDSDLISAIEQLLNRGVNVTYLGFENQITNSIVRAKARNTQHNAVHSIIIRNHEIVNCIQKTLL